MRSGSEIKKIIDLPILSSSNIGDVIKSLLKSASNYSDIEMMEVWYRENETTAIYYLGGGSGGDKVSEISVEDFIQYIVNDEFKEFLEKKSLKKVKVPADNSWKNSTEGWSDQIPEVNFTLVELAYAEIGTSWKAMSLPKLTEKLTGLFLENSYDVGDDDMDFPYEKYARKLAKRLKQANPV